MKRAPSLPAALDALEARYGAPAPPLPRKALDWVLWENAAYLVSDEQRARAFAALKRATRLEARGILACSRGALLELAQLGGMQPERRVLKLLAIAETVREHFDGDLEGALRLPLAKARKALERFPGIGRPGADKILLFTGAQDVPALESNGLRVLVRLGHAREEKGYSATYRGAIAALEAHVDRGGAWLRRAYDLLRAHGKATCKNTEPSCEECALAERCPSAS